MIGFYRTTGGQHCVDYFESRTEVLVIGDISGFRVFLQTLRTASSEGKAMRMQSSHLSPFSMDVSISAPLEGLSSFGVVRVIERPIYEIGSERPNMEMVILGDSKGYALFELELAKIANKVGGDIYDHIHIDDGPFSILMPRSLMLNVRSPLRCFNEKELGDYAHLLRGPSPNYFPREIRYMVQEREPYESVSPEQLRSYLISRK